ncbi:MAG: hypothetical protein ACYTEW_22800 [Planctomycetota bacterium]|jgi:hypothetical protein
MEQKDLFEASAHRLPYVECSPNGRGAPIAPVCKINNIRSYPTWIIGGQRYEGVLEPDQLAELTSYPGTQ